MRRKSSIRVLSVFIIVSLLLINLSVIPSQASGKLTLSISSANGEVGKTAQVTLSIANITNAGVQGVPGGTVEIQYDPSMLSITEGNIAIGGAISTMMPTKSVIAPGHISITWATGDTGLTQNAALATLTFNILKAGAANVSFKSVLLSDENVSGIPSSSISLVNGSISGVLVISPTAVTLNKTSLNLMVGDTDSLAATVAPADATNKAVTWASSNAAVATVDANGKVTAKAAGTATITATTSLGGKKASAAVTVSSKPINVSSVNINKTNITIGVGQTDQLSPLFTPSNATNKKVSWSSSNNSIVKVDANGKITAIAKGSATITITTDDGGKTSSTTVTVVPPVDVTGVSLSRSSITLEVGKTEELEANVLPLNATNKEVTWSSSNTSIATVNNLGVVTAVAKGSATITATTVDGQKKAVCNVKVVEEGKEPTNTKFVIESGKDSVDISKDALSLEDTFEITYEGTVVRVPAPLWKSAVEEVMGNDFSKVTVTIKKVTENLSDISPVYEYKLNVSDQNVSNFGGDLTIEIAYNSEKVTNEDNLSIYWYNEETQKWEKIESQVDKESKVVKAQVNHWSRFVVMEQEEEKDPGNTKGKSGSSIYVYFGMFLALLVGFGAGFATAKFTSKVRR